MKLRDVVEQIQDEAKLIQGEATKDVLYTSQHTFPDEHTAREAFPRSVEKLLNVNGWSTLSSFLADFVLHDSSGKLKPDGPVQVDDYIQVLLPGPMPENWVRVIQVSRNETGAEFTVQPSADPRENHPEQIEHFFDQQARSTFQVALSGCTINACEIGKYEAINNQQPHAGNRSLLNTVIAEAGWLFYQKMQWQTLTDYLVDV